MNKIIIIYAPSGAGKTTLEEKIITRLSYSLARLLYGTTRDIREGEIDGVHAKFISIKEFNNTDFAATEVINDNWKYGIFKESLENLDKDYFISIISFDYVKKLYDYCIIKNIPVDIYYLNVDKEERIKRLINRGENEESIRIRLDREDLDIDNNIKNLSMKNLDLNNKSEEDVFELFKTIYLQK